MEWLETELGLEPDADGVVRWETSTQIIARHADALGGVEMKRIVDEFFLTQKRFAEYLGVGESTVAGWFKANSFPDYAKRASMAAIAAHKKSAELATEVARIASPTVVKDGSTFSLVSYQRDAAGSLIGSVVAKEVPSAKVAHILASAPVAWQLVHELCEATDYLWRDDSDPNGDFAWLRDLHERAYDARHSAMDHDGYLRRLQRQAERRAEEKRELEALKRDISLRSSPSNDLTKEGHGDDQA